MCPAAHLLVGHSLDRAISKDSCRIDITEGTGAGVAMTVGNAVAGGTPAIQRHEDVHPVHDLLALDILRQHQYAHRRMLAPDAQCRHGGHPSASGLAPTTAQLAS